MGLNEGDLKLIYVLKIGYNSKGEGLYEFIFSMDETNVDIEDWCWDISPACDNAEPPPKDYINGIFNLKTSSFNLVCLHESVERSYVHGYHNIIALAYEDIDQEIEPPDGFNQYEDLFDENEDDDTPVLVFHYGTTLEQVKEMLYERRIILKGNEFVESSSIDLN
jgi:hypothetical protein